MMDGDSIVPHGRPREMRRSARGDAAPDPLARLADDLERLVAAADEKPKPRTVHQLRTTIRRFETVLPAASVDEVRGARKLLKQLDRIRKRAGRVRDVDVHLKALATIPSSVDEEAQDAVQAALEKSRAKRRRRLAEVLADESDDGLSKRLRQVVGRAVSSDASADTLGTVLARFDEIARDSGTLDGERLHQFRIDTKRLRYLAETAPSSPEAIVAIGQLKRIQDAIGAWHDWLTLAERGEEVLAKNEASPLLAELRARTQAKLDAAKKITAAATQRLAVLRGQATRKRAHSMRSVRPAPTRSAGVSA
jgi:CHAD domain-containing protein